MLPSDLRSCGYSHGNWHSVLYEIIQTNCWIARDSAQSWPNSDATAKSIGRTCETFGRTGKIRGGTGKVREGTGDCKSKCDLLSDVEIYKMAFTGKPIGRT